MNLDSGKVGQGIRCAGLLGACAFLLGPVVFGTAASLPNPRRDGRINFPADVAAATAADRTLVADAQPELKKDESFTDETKVVAYRFRLDSSSDMVHLNVSAEVKHGLVSWELIDPSGAVRLNIGTTERASMDETELTGMRGRWVLRMNFQAATGRYHISWIALTRGFMKIRSAEIQEAH